MIHCLSVAARHSTDESPKADALIDSIIVLVEQAPPLSLEAIERSITSSDSMVLFCFVHFILFQRLSPFFFLFSLT
jgi:hypothetical protein